MKVPDTWDTHFYWKLKDEVRKVVDENPDMSHKELMWQIMHHETRGTVNPKMISEMLHNIMT